MATQENTLLVERASVGAEAKAGPVGEQARAGDRAVLVVVVAGADLLKQRLGKPAPIVPKAKRSSPRY